MKQVFSGVWSKQTRLSKEGEERSYLAITPFLLSILPPKQFTLRVKSPKQYEGSEAERRVGSPGGKEDLGEEEKEGKAGGGRKKHERGKNL